MTKIIYKQGDMFRGPEFYVAHGCNAQGVMGSGVAKIVKDQYPQAYEAYRKTYVAGDLYVGTVIGVNCGSKYIINAITQEYYGRTGAKFVSYDAIEDCIKAINDYGQRCVAMPLLGAGLGGGNWDIISNIIEKTSTFQPVVYKL